MCRDFYNFNIADFFTMLGATFVFAIVTVLELSVIYAKGKLPLH